MVYVSRSGHQGDRPKLAGSGWGRGGAVHRHLTFVLALAATLLLLWRLPSGILTGRLHLTEMSLSSGGGSSGGSSSFVGPGAVSSWPQLSTVPLSAVALEMLPALQRRPEQLALEARWGAAPVLAPQPGPSTQRIPRILHHVYFPNISSFLTGNSRQELLAQSCRRMHPSWQYVFWDEAAAIELVNKHYPDFAEMFASLNAVIKRVDAIRYFIMHAIGGFYLDTDIECFAPVEAWMAGYDVVLQDPGPTNGVVASVPGHPLWMAALRLMKERWQENPWRAVVEATGPGLLSSTFKHSGLGFRERPEQADPWSGLHRFADSDVMVYPLGQYFHPCDWDNRGCHREITVQRALGSVNLTRLAGYHRFSASWWGNGPNGGISVSSEEQLKQQLCG